MINIIDVILERLSSISTSSKAFEYINRTAIKEGVIFIRIHDATVKIEQDKRMSFKCECTAYLRHKVELCEIGELSLAIPSSYDLKIGAERFSLDAHSMGEQVTDLGGNQLESSRAFSFFYECEYDKAKNKLKQIDWENQ